MKRIIALMLACVCVLSACGFENSADTQNLKIADGVENTEKSESAENAIPGSYTLPDGWVEYEKYSTPEKMFYVEKGHTDDEQPDNISVNIGTNKYAAAEHESFRDAVVRQLAAQLDGVGANLTGDGTYTAHGDIVYIFTIEEDSGVVTKQYYIIGDYRYCLVHTTNFDGSDSVNEAAGAIVDSFVWE